MSAPVSRRTLTIYTKGVTYMLACRQKLNKSGTTANSQSVVSKQTNGMMQWLMVGVCVWVVCVV